MALGCTVAELLNRISSKELTEWMAYERLEPFGPPAANMNAAIIASMYANVHRGKNDKPILPGDIALGEFGSSRTNEHQEQSVEEQKQILMMLAQASWRGKK